MRDEFHVAKQAPAVLKHGIVSRYLVPFIAKVGSRAPGNRVVIVDGFAGPGTYDDGSPGSALLLARIARKSQRDVVVLLCEKSRQHHAALVAALEGEGHALAHPPMHSTFADALPEILKIAGDSPAFFLVDPYGLGISFDDVVAIMNRGAGLKTEVCVNFSANAIRRIGGRLKEPAGSPGREATLAGLDRACGGDWWRAEWQAANGVPGEASERIVAGYFRRLCAATSAAGWSIEARKSPSRQPEYHLVFLSRHRDGVHLFGDAISLAQADWRNVVTPEDLLRDIDEAALEASWISEISSNIQAILAAEGAFTLADRYAEVMGSALGYAREKHVRAALKPLHEAGAISTRPVGSPLWPLRIVPAS